MSKNKDVLGELSSHESYGAVCFSRVSIGGGMNLVGSSLKHSEVISLSIKTAERRHGIGDDHYYDNKEIIEVLLSPTQFAELITHMNVGSGVPCTITRNNGKMVARPPVIDKEAEFEADLKEINSELIQRLSTLVSDVTEKFKKASVGKGDREKIMRDLDILISHLKSNIPFVEERFRESMEKTTTEAKASVEAFVERKIRSIGIDAIEKGQLVSIPESRRVESKVLPQE